MEDCSKEKCNCSCRSQEPCNHEHHEEAKSEGFCKFLLELADCAWSEVLKEKIKEHILSTQGDKMSELAKIVSETNNHRWKNKMEKRHGCMDFKEKICRFFGHSSK